MRLESINHPKVLLSSQEWSSSKRLVNLFSHAIWKVIYRIRAQKLLSKLKNPNNTIIEQSIKDKKIRLPLTFLNNQTLERGKSLSTIPKEINLFKTPFKLSTELSQTLFVSKDFIAFKPNDYSTTIQWKFKSSTKTKTDLLESSGIARFLKPLSL